MGMALGFSDVSLLGGDSTINVDLQLCSEAHKELHDALQPVFCIMQKNFPCHKLVVRAQSAQLMKEEFSNTFLSGDMVENILSLTDIGFTKEFRDSQQTNTEK